MQAAGKKKEHKLKLLGPDILRWGGVIPREGMGVKKFGLSLEAQGNKVCGGISRNLGWDVLGAFEKKSSCSLLGP